MMVGFIMHASADFFINNILFKYFMQIYKIRVSLYIWRQILQPEICELLDKSTANTSPTKKLTDLQYKKSVRFAIPVCNSTEIQNPTTVNHFVRTGSTLPRSARRTSSWCRWASSLFGCWRSRASAPPTPVPRASASACSARGAGTDGGGYYSIVSDADEQKASAVPDAAAAAGARPARGCADRAEPSGAAGHCTDSDQAVLQPATKRAHDFLN